MRDYASALIMVINNAAYRAMQALRAKSPVFALIVFPAFGNRLPHACANRSVHGQPNSIRPEMRSKNGRSLAIQASAAWISWETVHPSLSVMWRVEAVGRSP